MKKYYNVSFKWDENTYCANIAHAESVEDVEANYSEYTWYSVTEASEYDVKAAQRKGMPIVEIETAPKQKHTETARETKTTVEGNKMEKTINNNGNMEGDKMTTNTNTNTRREAAIAAIIEYFNDNEDVFNDCMEELDGYNGYLGDDRYYSMDELDELFCDSKPSEILARAFYGYDAESWTTDSSGNRVYSAFNPNRGYFYFNGYGNLVSADYKDYSNRIDHYAVEDMAENRAYIDAIDDDSDLSALFDALEEAENEED